jgi:hypothetical protein
MTENGSRLNPNAKRLLKGAIKVALQKCSDNFVPLSWKIFIDNKSCFHFSHGIELNLFPCH